MTDTIHCVTHGESSKAYVCDHLTGEAAGLGFNRNEPTRENPFPDAWCDNCELIRTTHGGWNEESEKLLTISLVCAECYGQLRIRNTRTSFTLQDLVDFRWKCGNCEEWHTGACLDFTYDSPDYWCAEYEQEGDRSGLLSTRNVVRPKTFLNDDYCAINDNDFFIRGLIQLPIIGTSEALRWGVWGSLSRENFEIVLKMDESVGSVKMPPMFSWLSTQMPEYPDTLLLKMHAHFQGNQMRPIFELELTDHPLSQEFHKGITAERVKEIMLGRLSCND